MIARIPLLCLAGALLAPAALAQDLPGSGRDNNKTVVYRDSWGIPHIYAPTAAEGMYAMGWAQAEDRPEQLLRNFAYAMGAISKADGPDGIQSDVVAKMWAFYETSRDSIDALAPEVHELLAAYVDGVNAYYDANASDVPAWWTHDDVDVAMTIAFLRLFLHSWSIQTGFADLTRGGIEPGLKASHRGSNQWVVAPERTASGHAIMCVDPHLAWWDMTRFWEFRIHAGDIVGSGFTLPGQCFIGLGHNEKVAWAMTTGGPDTADIFVLAINPENPLQYRFDGAWRDFEPGQIVVEVAGLDEPYTQPLLRSHHGPVIAIADGKAYAHAMAYANELGGAETWLAFNRAETVYDIREALNGLQLFPQNVMCTDQNGEIYYQRTGRVPRRALGYDWSMPVDGSTSGTDWQGVHPAEDLVQLLNPVEGYLQNCNVAPDRMLPNSPLTADRYVGYIYDYSKAEDRRGGQLNQRGPRAVELLSADADLTIDEAMAIALDVSPYGAARWVEVLGTAAEANPRMLSREVRQALEDVLAWDGRLAPDSTGGLKYTYWREQLDMDGTDPMDAALAAQITDLNAPYRGAQPLPELSQAQQQQLLASFDTAMGRLHEDWGRIDAVYGDRFRVGRDDIDFPVGGGARPIRSTETLRYTGFGERRDDGTQIGTMGQTQCQLVVLSDPIQSWTGPPIGQSDRPESPHYRDQAEKLYSPGKLKDTWWTPEALADHIVSRSVLR